jgi:hypothetical protein
MQTKYSHGERKQGRPRQIWREPGRATVTRYRLESEVRQSMLLNRTWCIGALLLLSFGCAKHPQSAPPQPPAVSRPAPPYPGAYWINGHHKWSGGQYVWVAGHWSKPQAGKQWVPGHWQKTPRGYHWVDGHWQGAAAPPTHPPRKPRKKPRRR